MVMMLIMKIDEDDYGGRLLHHTPALGLEQWTCHNPLIHRFLLAIMMMIFLANIVSYDINYDDHWFDPSLPPHSLGCCSVNKRVWGASLWRGETSQNDDRNGCDWLLIYGHSFAHILLHPPRLGGQWQPQTWWQTSTQSSTGFTREKHLSSFFSF